MHQKGDISVKYWQHSLVVWEKAQVFTNKQQFPAAFSIILHNRITGLCLKAAISCTGLRPLGRRNLYRPVTNFPVKKLCCCPLSAEHENKTNENQHIYMCSCIWKFLNKYLSKLIDTSKRYFDTIEIDQKGKCSVIVPVIQAKLKVYLNLRVPAFFA